jgi:eukaryotic-like serine/threonine-protein kinase
VLWRNGLPWRLRAGYLLSVRGKVRSERTLLCQEHDHGHLQSEGCSVQLKRGSILAGRYRIDQLIGIGGTGMVYAATHVSSGARAALKVIRELTTRPERIAQEVRIAANLTHPNIVRAHDVFEDEGCTVVVYELCHGCSLAQALRQGALSPAQACAVVLSVLDGLAVAHAANVLHRDLKPQNIMLAVTPDGSVVPKLLDFGIAKDLSQTQGITVTQQSLGTPKYMSPEQIRSEKLGPQSDIFSLGAVLFECVTGSSPFDADSTAASLAAVLEREVLPDERLPPALWMIVARALSKRSYERYQTCAEFTADLERTAIAPRDAAPQLLEQIPIAPLPALEEEEVLVKASVSNIDSPQHRRNVRPALALGAGVAAVITLGLIVAAPAKMRISALRTRASVERTEASQWAAPSSGTVERVMTIVTPPPSNQVPARVPQGRGSGVPRTPTTKGTTKAAVASTGIARTPGF